MPHPDLDAILTEAQPLTSGGSPTVRQIAQAAQNLVAEVRAGRDGAFRWDQPTTPLGLYQISDADCATFTAACDTVLAGNFNEAAKSLAWIIKDLIQQILRRREGFPP